MRRILTVTFSNQKFAPGGMNPRGNPDCRVLRWQNRIKDTDQTTKYPSMSEEVTMQAGEPSHTARGAAAYRAIHQTLEGGIIFSDPFASKILDDETRARRDEIAAKPSLRPMRLFIAARSRFSEDTLAACVARGVRQVVVLGAGLDTFSLRNPYAWLGVRVFEVDYPATQQWKRERLNEAGLAIPGSLTFAPVDFERQSLADGLKAAGLDADRPAFFQWLGAGHPDRSRSARRSGATGPLIHACSVRGVVRAASFEVT